MENFAFNQVTAILQCVQELITPILVIIKIFN